MLRVLQWTILRANCNRAIPSYVVGVLARELQSYQFFMFQLRQITRISLKSQEIPQENRSKINTRTQVRDAITAGFFVVRQIFSLNINKKLHVHKNRTRRNSVEVQRIVHCTV